MARELPSRSTPSPTPPVSDATERQPSRPKRSTPRAAAFRILVEDCDEGLILADENGVITYANTASERYLGRRVTELVGRLVFDLCQPEDVPLVREAFDRAFTYPGRPISVAIASRDSHAAWPRLAVKLLNRLPAPGVHAVVVQVHGEASADAGQRRVRDDEAAAYRSLFEQAPVGLCVSDRDGTLLAFNDATLRPGGYTRDDLQAIGNVALFYASAAERERIGRLAREQGYVWREEVGFLRKDGSRYEARLSLTPVRFRGRDCWYAAVEDITELKRSAAAREVLEAQLRQAQKMEAVGRMTGGVAHDFNNILSVIMANAALVTASLESGRGDAQSELKEIRHAARRGATMIRKLLGFSRNVDLDVVATDVGDVVDHMEQMLRHVIPEHMVLELDTALHCVALCDAGAVEQALLNLATNARDAMPEGGVVRIAVAPTHVEEGALRPAWLAPGDFIRISVADSGVGMDAETMQRAMEPFFTTKGMGAGSGLGLSMVYGLVKQQGGFIDIQSQRGRGTTVRLYFPRTESLPRKPRITPSAAAPKHGSATILLIEDDDSLRRTGERVLRYLGYRVLLARDGQAGLQLFEQRADEIDLVISDMVMPGLTGAQVYEAIRGRHLTVPFLLSSGYQERVGRTLTVPKGVHVVPKPWTIEELAATIWDALSGAT